MQSTDEVLVLKSSFNTAWDFFSAKDLGDTMLGFWRQWLSHAKAGKYNLHFPKFSGDAADLALSPLHFYTQVGSVAKPLEIPDLRKTNLLNQQMLFSRKRTHNLFNLTNLWKKMVFTQLEHNAIKPEANLP